MKIAVTTQENRIYEHFGKCACFTIFEVTEQAAITRSELNADGGGHGALVKLLKNEGVNALLCGGIGGPAKEGLEQVGIKVVSGLSGDVQTALLGFLQGKLQGEGVTCNHHHEAGHDCSTHTKGHECHCH